MNLTDFLKGVDITGLPAVNAGDLNNLVDEATLNDDRGIILWTQDSALNTPVVPDASALGYTHFVRYIWLRIPFNTDGEQTPAIYGWNAAATSDATYLKWLQLTPDLTELTDTVNTALANSITAIGSAQTANVNATNANSLSQQAATLAAAANTTANSAATNASAALTALNGQTNVSGAITSLEASVASATGNAAAQKAPKDALVPGNVGYQIRTSAGATPQAEWFDPAKNIVVLIDSTGGASTNGAYTRQFVIASDAGNNAVVAAGLITLTAGTYFVNFWTQSHGVNHNCKLSGSSTIWGTSSFSPSAVAEPCMLSMGSGIIVSDGITQWSIISYSNTVQAGGFGKATGLAGVTEVYGYATFVKLKPA